MLLLGSHLSRFILALFALTLGLLILPDAVHAVTNPSFILPEQRLSLGSTGWLAEFSAHMSEWQSYFYRQLTGAVRAWQQDGWAPWLLLYLSFAYGVFHALGPGHGKAVLSAYVLANRETVRNGALLALLSAFLQALVAIILVGIAAGLLNVSGLALNRATLWLEVGSYALMVALGGWLFFRQAVRPFWQWFAQRFVPTAIISGHVHPHSDHHHCQHEQSQPVVDLNASNVCHNDSHHHTHSCGHLHVPDPEMLRGQLTWSKAGSAILAVGLRPCTGAIFVLVFSLAQGFFIGGVAAALAMGLGTGLTVAVLTVASLWISKTTVKAAGGYQRKIGRLILSLVQMTASLLLFCFGVLLLSAALSVW